MRKTIALLMLLSLLLQLAACSAQELPAQSTAPADIVSTTPSESPLIEETTAATEQTLLPQAPLVAVSLPTHTEAATAQDGTVIFNYTFQNISLITQDADVADLVIIDFLNRIDATRLTADRIHSLAKSAYPGQSTWTPYLCMISYAPMRIDAGVLSLFGTQAGFYGSTHPETVYSSVNYDLVTGRTLTLGDILLDTATTDDLLSSVLGILKKQEKELYLYEGYEDTVSAYFASSDLQNSWYFTPLGLCFYFAPYEIAPYSSGVVAPVVPYDLLAGVIRDEFFPAELDTAIGEIRATPFQQSDLTAYRRFAELIQDDDGEKLLLSADDTVRNVRIETGIWSSTGTFFTPQHTVFFASSLSAGDALMVQAVISSDQPQLLLSYETDNGTVTAFITKNDNGDLLLQPK